MNDIKDHFFSSDGCYRDENQNVGGKHILRTKYEKVFLLLKDDLCFK